MDSYHAIKNGKPSISMGHGFHGYVSHYQRVILQETMSSGRVNSSPAVKWLQLHICMHYDNLLLLQCGRQIFFSSTVGRQLTFELLVASGLNRDMFFAAHNRFGIAKSCYQTLLDNDSNMKKKWSSPGKHRYFKSVQKPRAKKAPQNETYNVRPPR
jgi:hypothetical protein